MASHDDQEGKRPGSRRSPVVLILAVLGACGLLGILGLVGAMLLARRELARIDAHFEAVQQAADAPGQPVPDPKLHAGSLEVQLVAAAPELHVEQIATLQIGAQVATWARSPVRFDHLGSEPWAIAVAGPYVVEPVSVRVPPGGDGAQLAVRAIPIDLALPYASDPKQTPEKVLEVDLTRPDALDLRWKQGNTVVAMDLVPRSPEALAGLAARFEAQWTQQRGHFDALDPKLDQATVRIARETPFAEVFPVVEALLAIRRVMDVSGQSRRVAALHVSVQPLPLPLPRPRAEPCPPADAAPAWKGRAPRVRVGAVQISGRLAPAVVEGVAATTEAEVRRCYLDGLRRDPTLQGRVAVRFVIGRDGAVSNVQARSEDLIDAATLEGIRNAFEELTFPRPEGGIVTVTYPFLLAARR